MSYLNFEHTFSSITLYFQLLNISHISSFYFIFLQISTFCAYISQFQHFVHIYPFQPLIHIFLRIYLSQYQLQIHIYLIIHCKFLYLSLSTLNSYISLYQFYIHMYLFINSKVIYIFINCKFLYITLSTLNSYLLYFNCKFLCL